jgi:hypothetical protein
MATAIVAHRERRVDGHADLQAVDRLTGLPDAVPRDLERHALGVEQFALDVPQPVIAAVATEYGGAGVLGGAGRWAAATARRTPLLDGSVNGPTIKG